MLRSLPAEYDRFMTSENFVKKVRFPRGGGHLDPYITPFVSYLADLAATFMTGDVTQLS
jgi:hypothetical protein